MLYYFNSQQISNIADVNYRYEGTKQETPPAEATSNKKQEFSYDANGNLIYTATGTVKDTKLQATKTRKLLWDEENRLLGVSDNGFVSQYWYDAAGERTVKESFDNEGVYVNGALSGARTGTSKFTAYVSPYMVVSQGGNYTKHVYMGSQRITSKLSNSGIFKPEINPVNTTEQQAKLAQQTTLIKERFDSLGVKYSGVQQTGGLVSTSPATTADSYFYHPDHLGSSSLITNKDGYLVQHIQYVPFGEVFVEERNANWSTPYKFNGKEQDEETGLCYYGARYYDPKTSVWLSVDPLAEKYPNWSSYNYCMNNPINVIDPDGKDTFNININTRKIDRIPVENSKTHTYNIMLFGKQKSSTTLDINDKGQVKFPDRGMGFDRYASEPDPGGDHYLEADAAAALFGLSAEMRYELNGKIDYGDMSNMSGKDPYTPGGKHHSTHGGNKGLSGLCIDYRYLDGNNESYQGNATDPKFSSDNNVTFLAKAYHWGFKMNYISNKDVWKGFPINQINGKQITGHNDHGHLTYIRKK